MIYRLLPFIAFVFFNIIGFSQGRLTGNFRFNADFYDHDPSIGTEGPNYLVNKSSANAWMQTIYNNTDWDFEAGIRFDGNYNSILQNPPNPVSFYGIGNWYLKKKVKNLEVTAGYIYEQYGSGISLRTFEARNLGIDNSILGVKTKYEFGKNTTLKTIAGVQKYVQLGSGDGEITDFGSFIKGANLEHYHKWKKGKITLPLLRWDIPFPEFTTTSGIAVVNRTFSNEARDKVVSGMDNYGPTEFFKVPYNAIVYHLYNTLSVGRFTWTAEGAYKKPDVVFNQFTPDRPYSLASGFSIYNSLSYSKPKLGITFQNRYIADFQFGSEAHQDLNFYNTNNRSISYIAPINRQNSLRLPARFQVAPQGNGEVASSLDLTYKLAKNKLINISLSMIDTNDITDPYYREVYADMEIRKLNIFGKKVDLHFGGQYAYFNQQLYQREGDKDVESIIGFVETTVKLNRKNSIRTEFQLQHAPKELGTTGFVLVEYNIAPSWSFSVSDMWNFIPNKKYFSEVNRESHHYFSIFGSYTKGVNRLTLAYVKQIQGIVCTGGVCRVEPTYSGLRAQLTTSF